MDNPDANLEDAKTALGIEDVDQGELEELCKQLLEENPKVVSQYKDGNKKALGALIGAAKKKNPNADPKLVQQICRQLIEAS